MIAQRNEHQKMLFQILCEFDRICQKYNLKYTLFGGTAIGAARHKGFVPWDDDIDVAMLRPEYERFLEVATAELDPKTYYLQKEFSEHWPMFFSKIRVNNTACIECYVPKDLKTHQGVYIDIFPIDNLRPGKLGRSLQFLASKAVIAKSLDRRGYLTNSKKKKCFMLLCKILPGKPLRRFCRYRGRNDTKQVHSFFAAASKYEKNIYPRIWFTQMASLEFEGREFSISACYDQMLTTIYGNYMTLPSEADRACKVHGEIVDLENSYEKYLETQKTMKFKGQSRSIR